MVVSYNGTIISVEPENAIFGFPSKLIIVRSVVDSLTVMALIPTSKGANSRPFRLQGMSVCDVIDVFDDWRQKSGSTDMQLLMLALLDKDREMPGVSLALVRENKRLSYDCC